MSDPTYRILADLLRQEHPRLCEELEIALRAGMSVENAEALTRYVHAQAPVLAGCMWAFLCDVDPEFRRVQERKGVQS